MIARRAETALRGQAWASLEGSYAATLHGRLVAAVRRPEEAGFLRESALDSGDLTRDEVVQWLKSHGICGPVDAIWISAKEGIRLDASTFFEHYDDLWFPAADDIVVSSRDGAWLLYLGHEEDFVLWRRSQSTSA